MKLKNLVKSKKTALPPSLAHILLEQGKLPAKTPVDTYNRELSGLLSQAQKYTTSLAIGDLIQSLMDFGPDVQDCLQYLSRHGCPIQDKTLWAEFPCRPNPRTAKLGVLLEKSEEGVEFTYASMVGVVPNMSRIEGSVFSKKDKLFALWEGHTAKNFYPANVGDYSGKYVEYSLSREHFDASVRSLELSGMPMPMNKVIEKREASVNLLASGNNIGLFVLVLLRHQQMLVERGVIPKQDHTKTKPSPDGLHPLLSDPYIKKLQAIKSRDELCDFLGIEKINYPMAAFVQFGYKYAGYDGVQKTSAFCQEVGAKFPEAAMMKFGDEVETQVRETMRVIPPDVAADLFQRTALPFDKIWVEGVLPTDAVVQDKGSFFYQYCAGALIEKFDGHTSMRSLAMWEARNNEPFASTQTDPDLSYQVTIDDRLMDGPSLDNEDESDASSLKRKPGIVAANETRHFFQVLALMLQAQEEIITNAGLSRRASSSLTRAPGEVGSKENPRVKDPYIGRAKGPNHMIPKDVTKKKSGRRIFGKAREFIVLSDLSQTWESTKKEIRASCNDVLDVKNHPHLYRELSAAAKEMFGKDVTVQITRVPESKEMTGRVSGEPFTRHEHIRIDLVYEETDPIKLALKKAAYALLASRKVGVKTNVNGLAFVDLTVHPPGKPAANACDLITPKQG